MSAATTCDTCGRVLVIGDFPWCPHGSTRPYHPFPAFEISHNGQTYTVDSIEAARRVERESERAERDGRGRPLVFRGLSQDRSNRDVPTLAPHPDQVSQPTMREVVDRARRMGFRPDNREE